MTQEGDGERGLSVLAAWVACGQCHIFTPCMAQSRPTRFEFLRPVKRVHTACKMPSAIESVMAKAPTQRVRPMHTHLEEQAIGRGVGKKVLSHTLSHYRLVLILERGPRFSPTRLSWPHFAGAVWPSPLCSSCGWTPFSLRGCHRGRVHPILIECTARGVGLALLCNPAHRPHTTCLLSVCLCGVGLTCVARVTLVTWVRCACVPPLLPPRPWSSFTRTTD
jgi:hypothetical protein